ncbi:LacI family DNA-binding transcriptional regulator [Rhodobacteraceae bacterium 2CG4]|uniref:LacI family DNA-binding transcriptional regulator n=2 Tax=Halovulum marinum TaxID=2662447 RepID=A0A6L5Z0U8_9RHOB|nr:LacI family DNA-binding transcriptional regulator [Halovulum marinum]
MTGLGVTTVSRALKDAPDIGAATKERVRLVARQIGYRPNRAGVRLRTGKTNVISLILSVETEVLGLTSRLIYSISEYLSATPYHLVVTPYAQGADPLEPVRYIVETGSADGVIISRIEPRDPRIVYLREHGLPFATHGRSDMGVEHPYFDFDNRAYGVMAVERLAARGRRRLALLGPPPHLTYAAHMRGGFLTAVDRLDLDEVALHPIDTDSGEAAIEAEVRRVLAGRGRPDGLVCGSAASTITVVAAAEAAGLKIGRDLDVVGKESFGVLPKLRPEIIAIQEDFGAAGTALAEAVVRAIDGADPRTLQSLSGPR